MAGNTGAIILVVILLFVVIGVGIYMFIPSNKTTDDDPIQPTEQPTEQPTAKSSYSDLSGKTIICQGDKDGRYRMVDGKLRKYGSMDILKSWDPEYTESTATKLNCSGIPKSSNMAHK